jgi:hypothetical protein
MAEEVGTAEAPAYRDRKAGLIVFGIIEICIGLLCALFVPLMLMGMQMASAHAAGGGASWRTTLPGVFTYVGLAALFITVGIGSIRARRWARAIMLVFSWLWLIMGILSMAFFFYFFPVVTRQMEQGAPAAGGGMTGIVQVVMGLVLFPIYIVLPGAFLLFYRSRHVRETCRAIDPQRRWTDNCPLPVLALVMMMGIGLYSMLFMPFYNFVIPCFGVYLSGLPGAMVCLFVTALLLTLVRGLYKLKIAAWWGMVVLIPLGGISAGMSMGSENLPLMYEEMGIATQQVEAILSTGFFQGPGMVIYMVLASAAMLGYVFYTKRYFDAAANARQTDT